MKPAHIYDSVPTEEEVEWEVRRLRGNRSGFSFWMHAENLREWLMEHQVTEAVAEAEEKSELKYRARGANEGGEEGEDQEQSKWDMVVELV